MDIDVRTNIAEIKKMFDGVRNDQLPFATAQALNATANDVAKRLTDTMERYIDRPTPATKKAWMFSSGRFRGYPAKKNYLIATIVPPAAIAEYLKWTVFGGTKVEGGAGSTVPYDKNARLNRFGNIVGKRSGLLKGKRDFIGNIKGIDGVWRRTGGRKTRGVKLIHAFEKTVHYQSQYPIFEIANKTVKRKLASNFNREFRKAIASARPR